MQGKPAPEFVSDPTNYRFSSAEDAFWKSWSETSFRYFWEEANPYTGLVKDRSQAGGPDARPTASIAATGFGLTALCIADQSRLGGPQENPRNAFETRCDLPPPA